MKTVIGVFQHRDEAERAIEQLRNNGIESDNIGLVMRDPRPAIAGVAHSDHTQEAATAGATFGGILGGIAGFLVGIGAFIIPGIGPIIAGGVLASTLGGAAIGAASGGLLGSLVGLGIPEAEARYYQERVLNGDILVTVNTAEDKAEFIHTILNQAGAVGFPDGRSATVPGNVTSSSSGIMGANMNPADDLKNVPIPAEYRTGSTTGTEALRPANSLEQQVLPPDIVPSGDKESRFIHTELNDYPIDASDVDVSIAERPLFGRGVEDIPAETSGNAPSDRTGTVIPPAATNPAGTQPSGMPTKTVPSAAGSGATTYAGNTGTQPAGDDDQGYEAADLRAVGREQAQRSDSQIRGIERGVMVNAPEEKRLSSEREQAAADAETTDTDELGGRHNNAGGNQLMIDRMDTER